MLETTVPADRNPLARLLSLAAGPQLSDRDLAGQAAAILSDAAGGSGARVRLPHGEASAGAELAPESTRDEPLVALGLDIGAVAIDRAAADTAIVRSAIRLLGLIAAERVSTAALGGTAHVPAASRVIGTVAHDLNNALAVILGQGEELAEDSALDPVRRSGAEMVVDGALRAAGLTRRMLALSAGPVSLQVPEIVAGLRRAAERALPKGVTLEIAGERTDAGAVVEADRLQLEAALLATVVAVAQGASRPGAVTLRISDAPGQVIVAIGLERGTIEAPALLSAAAFAQASGGRLTVAGGSRAEARLILPEARNDR